MSRPKVSLDWQDEADLLDSWEDSIKEEPKIEEKPKAATAPKPTPAAASKTTPIENDFFNVPSSGASDIDKLPPKKSSSSAIAAELERRKRLEDAVKKSDLESAQDLFSGKKTITIPKKSTSSGISSLDSSVIPETKEQFDEYLKLLVAKLNTFQAKKALYSDFVESLVKSLAASAAGVNQDLPARLASALSISGASAAAAKQTAAKGATSGIKIVAPPVAKKGPTVTGATSKKKDGAIDLNDYDNESYSDNSD